MDMDVVIESGTACQFVDEQSECINLVDYCLRSDGEQEVTVEEGKDKPRRSKYEEIDMNIESSILRRIMDGTFENTIKEELEICKIMTSLDEEEFNKKIYSSVASMNSNRYIFSARDYIQPIENVFIIFRDKIAYYCSIIYHYYDIILANSITHQNLSPKVDEIYHSVALTFLDIKVVIYSYITYFEKNEVMISGDDIEMIQKRILSIHSFITNKETQVKMLQAEIERLLVSNDLQIDKPRDINKQLECLNKIKRKIKFQTISEEDKQFMIRNEYFLYLIVKESIIREDYWIIKKFNVNPYTYYAYYKCWLKYHFKSNITEMFNIYQSTGSSKFKKVILNTLLIEHGLSEGCFKTIIKESYYDAILIDMCIYRGKVAEMKHLVSLPTYKDLYNKVSRISPSGNDIEIVRVGNDEYLARAVVLSTKLEAVECIRLHCEALAIPTSQIARNIKDKELRFSFIQIV